MHRFKHSGLWCACAVLLLVSARSESEPQASQPAAAPSPAPEAERIRLTNTPHELEIFPSFSPKGDLLAYSSDRKGSHEIYIRRMDGTGKERQLTRDGLHNVQADWSSDGKLIAYHSVRADGIWVIPAGGGKPRQAAKFGSDPAWSPDGRTITFQSEPLEALSLYTYSGMPPATLWLVPAAGGEPKQLTHLGRPHGGHGAPSWSADGKRITFVSSDIELSGELWSIAADGTDLRRVSGTTMPRDPVFSPDATSIFYSSPDPNRGYRWGVWQASLKGDKPSVVSTLSARHITLKRDGCQAVVSEMGMAGNLWSIPIDPKTSVPTGPAAPFTNDPDDRNSQPAFSPDRTRVAFHRVVDGVRFQIWLSDLEGRERKFLTREATYGSGPPVWLPDSKHLVFNSRPGDGTMLLKKVNTETGVVEPYRQLDPKWSWVRLSPEGQRIVFARTDEKSVANIWMLPSLDAKEPRQITFDKETADFPMWSPDGKWLAFRLRRGSDTQIGFVSADGGEVTQLTSGPGENWLPSWSPDSSKIAFAGLRDGIWNIYWVARTGGPIHKITSQPDKMTLWVRYPVWYPTGDRILFEYSETLSDLWLLNTCPGGSPVASSHGG
jgi:Tol biopolymer transport system component